jgi:hypothetical protein
MKLSYPFDASRAGGGLRRSAQPGAAAARPHRGPNSHPNSNPFQQRRFNARGWAGNGGSSASLVHDGGQAQLSLQRQKEVQIDPRQTQTGGITMEEGTTAPEENSALA